MSCWKVEVKYNNNKLYVHTEHSSSVPSNNRGQVIKPLQYQSTVAPGTVARVEPNIKWFSKCTSSPFVFVVYVIVVSVVVAVRMLYLLWLTVLLLHVTVRQLHRKPANTLNFIHNFSIFGVKSENATHITSHLVWCQHYPFSMTTIAQCTGGTELHRRWKYKYGLLCLYTVNFE